LTQPEINNTKANIIEPLIIFFISDSKLIG